MEYTIIIQKNKNGWYTGQCEQIPEAISQGETLEELKANMADAIKMIIDYKEALVFTFLGLLRLEGKTNVLASVTGAESDSCSGRIWK